MDVTLRWYHYGIALLYFLLVIPKGQAAAGVLIGYLIGSLLLVWFVVMGARSVRWLRNRSGESEVENVEWT